MKTQDDKDPNNKLEAPWRETLIYRWNLRRGCPTLDVLTEKLNYIHVNNKQMVMTVFASLKILIWLCGSMNKFWLLYLIHVLACIFIYLMLPLSFYFGHIWCWLYCTKSVHGCEVRGWVSSPPCTLQPHGRGSHAVRNSTAVANSSWRSHKS